MPGTGVRPPTRILLEIGDASAFASSAHLAAYAGLAPVTHPSGSSIRGEHPARTGNRKLKRAFFPPRTLPCPTRSAAPTTTGREPRAKSTTPP